MSSVVLSLALGNVISPNTGRTNYFTIQNLVDFAATGAHYLVLPEPYKLGAELLNYDRHSLTAEMFRESTIRGQSFIFRMLNDYAKRVGKHTALTMIDSQEDIAAYVQLKSHRRDEILGVYTNGSGLGRREAAFSLAGCLEEPTVVFIKEHGIMNAYAGVSYRPGQQFSVTKEFKDAHLLAHRMLGTQREVPIWFAQGRSRVLAHIAQGTMPACSVEAVKLPLVPAQV